MNVSDKVDLSTWTISVSRFVVILHRYTYIDYLQPVSTAMLCTSVHMVSASETLHKPSTPLSAPILGELDSFTLFLGC